MSLTAWMIVIIIFLFSCTVFMLRYISVLRGYLKELLIASKRVSAYDFTTRITMQAKGEMGELIDNFNSISGLIDRKIAESNDLNMRTKSILKSISHGVLAVDTEDIVMLINAEARDLIGYKESRIPEGRFLPQVVKSKEILDEINRVKGSNESHSTETVLADGRTLFIKSDPIYLEGNKSIVLGSIVNIEDITERKRLENLRTEFVANVSHELKTPLTSITGFVQTLKMNKDMPEETRDRFLGIIETESNRLKRLIEDVLTLSFIEQNRNVKIEDVDVIEIYNDVYNMIKHVALNKNVEVSLDAPESLFVKMSRDSLKQILLNLIENAIKYNKPDGRVDVLISKADNNLIIRIKDTGVGIPKEDIPRIFERFYRVDKARNRGIEGTGLGLAILKHLLICLNGHVEVDSELRVGSTFNVTIPLEEEECI